MDIPDYGAFIRSGMSLVPSFSDQLAQQVGLKAKQAEIDQANAQTQAISQKINRAQMFQKDLGAVQQNPDAKAVSALIMKYPEFGDQIKSGWDVKDKAAKDADLTQLGEVYSAAASGNWDLAAKQAQARVDADKAAGNADEGDQAMVDQMNAAAKGDTGAQKNVLTALGTHLAAVTGPDHFASVYGALKGGYTLDAGATRYDENGNVVAQSPFIKGNDGTIFERDGTPAGTAPTDATTSPHPDSHPINASPQAATVASALSGAGLPAPVVAGFMGNFHVEGGFDGAQGDGGSASGIAQWHNDRAANFEKVIGKPVTEATPAEQAKFVAWEMQNPEAAGMTVAQRDAIMNAKTPAQAASLIDQYYERSSGRDRQGRMTAASAFAAGGGSNGSAPASTAPAGYHVLVPGVSPDQYRTLTPAEVQQRGLDATQQYQLDTKTGALTGLGKIDASDQPVPGDSTKGGPEYLASLPPDQKALGQQAKLMTEGRLGTISSFALAKPYWQKILQMAVQYDPQFDMNMAPARKAAITAFTGTGKGAMLVGSINRVANHMDLLWNESKKLAGPNTGFGPLDTALATTGQAFERPDAKAYDTEVTFVAGELGKLAKAGVTTEGEVDKIINNLSRKNSAKTRESAIQAAVGIISGAVDPLKDQYNSAFTNDSTRPQIPWVTPKAQQVFSKIGGVDLSLTGAGADTNAPAGQAATPVQVNSPADAAKLSSGTLFRTPDGRILRKR